MDNNLSNWLKEKNVILKIILKPDDWFEIQIHTKEKNTITYGQNFFNTQIVDEKIKECMLLFEDQENDEQNMTFPVFQRK